MLRARFTLREDDDEEPEQATPEHATVEQLQRLRTALEREQVLIPQNTLLLTDQQRSQASRAHRSC